MSIDREYIRFGRSDLILKVENAAEWRRQKSVEYPQDARNAQAAESFGRLVKNLYTLPEDHPLWEKLARMWAGFDEDTTFHVVELHSEIRCLRLYGFDAPGTGDAAEFLVSYISAIEDLAKESVGHETSQGTH